MAVCKAVGQRGVLSGSSAETTDQSTYTWLLQQGGRAAHPSERGPQGDVEGAAGSFVALVLEAITTTQGKDINPIFQWEECQGTGPLFKPSQMRTGICLVKRCHM